MGAKSGKVAISFRNMNVMNCDNNLSGWFYCTGWDYVVAYLSAVWGHDFIVKKDSS